MIEYMTLGDVCTDIIDCPHESPEWKSEGIAVVRNFNLVNGQIDMQDGYYVDEDTYMKRTRRAVPCEGDIIFSREAPIGNCAIVPANFKCCLGQRLVLLKVNHEICSSEYLLTVLQSSYVKQQIDQVSKRGSIVSNFAIGDLHELVVPILDNQNDIANLSSVFAEKITNNAAICSDLEAMAKLLYDYWFVQFDFPDENGRPYKSSGGKMVWNEELKREIPEGWEVKPLRDVLDLLKDGTHNPPKRIEDGIPLLTGTMFGQSFLDYSQATFISERDYRSIHSQYAPKESDIVITKIGTLGNVNYLRDCDIPIAIHCNSALLRFPCNMKGMFSYIYCKSDEFQKRLRAAKGQSVQEFCSLDSINTVLMLLPEEHLICLYQSKMGSALNQMINISNENQQLASLRDFLLPMLINGQVKVGKAGE